MSNTQLQLVMNHHDKITTTSIKIAEIFEKEHKNVLRAIQDLECSKEFSRLNFEPSIYRVRGKEYPLYFITKDGFMMLAMGFTGLKAARFREAFIDAFNKMERALFQAKSPQLIPVYQTRVLSEPTKSCPEDRWCIFDQSHEIMMLIEREVGSVNQFDLADGSIGSHWAKYREGKLWATVVTTYWHEFADKRGKQQSKCYDYSELKYFKTWLKREYRPKLLYLYLKSKFKSDAFMRPRVEAMQQKFLGNIKQPPKISS